MSRRWLLVVLLCLPLSARADGSHAAEEERRRRANQVLRLLDNRLERPRDISGPAMDFLFALAFLRSESNTFIESDIEEIAKLKPFDGVCRGSLAPLKGAIDKLLKRLDDERKWLEEDFDREVKEDDEMTIPLSGWKKPAKDLAELKDRWKRLAILSTLDGTEPRKVRERMTARVAGIRKVLETLRRDEAKLTDKCFDAVARCQDRFGGYGPRHRPEDDLSPGLGLVLDGKRGEPLEIQAVMPDSPAKKTGKLRRGQRITKIVVGGKVYEKGELFGLLFRRYENGEEIKLYVDGLAEPVVYRVGPTIGEASLVRDKDYTTSGGKKARWIAVPDFETFGRAHDDSRTSSQVRDALMRDGDFDSVVLDLRGNPGGYTEEAMRVAALFVKDPALNYRGAPLSAADTRATSDPKVLARTKGKPVVLLVDGSSASSAEIVAGLLQSHGINVVVGSPTYGKGIAQLVHPVGKDRELTFTADEFYDACGQVIQGIGIRPDIRLPGAPGLRRMKDLSDVPRGEPSGEAPVPRAEAERVRRTKRAVDEQLNFDPQLGKLKELEEKIARFERAHAELRLSKEAYAAFVKARRELQREAFLLGLGRTNGSNIAIGSLSPYEKAVLRVVDLHLAGGDG